MNGMEEHPTALALYKSHLFGEALLHCTDAGIPLSMALYSVADSGPKTFPEATTTAREIVRQYREAK
jgi:hypothetical protein